MIPIISVVGKSDSGKTTVLEKLIPALIDHGLTVGTIKHDAHDFEMDRPGKDTYRHFQAGANRVMIAAAHKFALIQRTEGGAMSLDDMVDRFFSDVDLVLTEGYKSGNKPKIEVFRSGIHTAPLCSTDNTLIAMVSDVPFPERPEIPLFSPSDISEIADFIVDWLKARK
jgi:molybdopterin-guanine dinucleotide biosynthesis adapter protein